LFCGERCAGEEGGNWGWGCDFGIDDFRFNELFTSAIEFNRCVERWREHGGLTGGRFVFELRGQGV